MNEITIHGNLTTDPEMRFTRNGTPVVNFTVAMNRNRFDRASGEWVALQPVFKRVVAFGRLAENATESLRKGDSVTVTGQLADDSYSTESGERRRAEKLEASEIAASLRYATVGITRNKREATRPVAEPAAEMLPEAPAGQPVEEPTAA